MELRLPLEMSPGREAACRSVFVEIAEYDLEIRGPGDFFNETGAIRQHGQMNFRLAAACRDPAMIERASFYAKRAAEEDPNLEKPENRRLASRLAVFTRKTEKTQN